LKQKGWAGLFFFTMIGGAMNQKLVGPRENHDWAYSARCRREKQNNPARQGGFVEDLGRGNWQNGSF
jgi:hypothetical protein